jgi:hypothetical protein
MPIADIAIYAKLKDTLIYQVNSDDAIANIQTTLNSIASQKTTILTKLPTSTVLDTDHSNKISTFDKMNFIVNVKYCIDNDTQLFAILIDWHDKLGEKLHNATDSTIISNLQTKIMSQTSIIKKIIPPLFTNLITFIIHNQ